ncbi:MAG: YpdA family putative bacillithiol disulfide reductase [Flavobacteriales bacterium]
MLDVLIIGGGPIGMACGIEAQKRQLTYKIIEKGVLVNALYHYPVNMTFFSSSEKLEIGKVPFVSTNSRPTRNEALEYFRRVQQHWDLDISLFEKVEKIIKKENKIFTIKTSKSTYQAQNIVIATGFYDKPHLLNIEGENLPKVKHYYDDPHYYINQKVAVIGASNSAIDAALEIYRKGADVTLIIRGKEIGHRVKYWIKPDILNRIEEGSIKVYYQSEVKKITSQSIIMNTSEGQIEIENDWVLAMTGYEPDFEFLKNVGIHLQNDGLQTPEYNPETQESNVKGIYLAGVVCGGMCTNIWFIENSKIHAEKIMEAIKIKKPV